MYSSLERKCSGQRRKYKAENDGCAELLFYCRGGIIYDIFMRYSLGGGSVMSITENRKQFNIIFACGSVAPMIASLQSIQNGHETWALLERGALYSGIDHLENFHNMGFDTTRNQLVNDEAAFSKAVERVKLLNENNSDAFFNFYVDDKRVFGAAYIADAAGVKRGNFHITLIEDGIDTYKYLDHFYGKGALSAIITPYIYRITKREWFSEKVADFVADRIKALSAIGTLGRMVKNFADFRISKNFKNTAVQVDKIIDDIFAGKTKQYADLIKRSDYRWPLAAACTENYSYIIQNRSKLESIANSGCIPMPWSDKSDSPYKPHIIYSTLSDMIKILDEQQLQNYMKLMLNTKDESVRALITRTERGGEKAPLRKLVYIMPSFDTLMARPVTNGVYGLGTVRGDAAFPRSYAQLDEKYKNVFLFPCEEDYSLLTEAMERYIFSASAPSEEAEKAAAKVFGLYADYIFCAKLIYKIYGESYDLLVKNHPRTDILDSSDWPHNYDVSGDGWEIDMASCLADALRSFHSSDSTGRYTGVADGKVSTENFEYLNADVSFCGQPSSVYSGLSDEAQIVFAIADSDDDLAGSEDGQFAYSAFVERYKEGRMKYTDADGTVKDGVFYNTGNILRTCAEIAEREGDAPLAEKYSNLFKGWLAAKRKGAADITPQGFAVKP